MIVARNVWKVYETRSGRRTVLRNVNMTVHPGEKIGIIGRNGAGKSTVIRLLSGAEWPTEGKIERHMSVSWPLAFGGAFQTTLTGLDNLKFICRIHGVSYVENVSFVEDFCELGAYFLEPVRTYSAGMRARLAFAISMVVEFDCFLIDEIVAVGDSRFHAKCHDELFVKRADRAMIIVSHDIMYVRDHCERVGILNNGEIIIYDNIDEAIDHYNSI